MSRQALLNGILMKHTKLSVGVIQLIAEFTVPTIRSTLETFLGQIDQGERKPAEDVCTMEIMLWSSQWKLRFSYVDCGSMNMKPFVHEYELDGNDDGDCIMLVCSCWSSCDREYTLTSLEGRCEANGFSLDEEYLEDVKYA
jgi:hypothetical protein